MIWMSRGNSPFECSQLNGYNAFIILQLFDSGSPMKFKTGMGVFINGYYKSGGEIINYKCMMIRVCVFL